MATFIDPGSNSTAIQNVEPGKRSLHHRPHELEVYTFEEYKTLMRKNLDDSKHKIRQQLEQHLKDKLPNVNDRFIKELVTDILDPNKNVRLYSNHYSDHNYDDICREYKTRYNKIKDYKFLLINAPTKTAKFDVNEDRQFREKQYERIKTNIEDKESFTTAEVTTHAELEAETRKFIVSTAKDTLHAYIVFNGHGSSDGLVLNGEESCYNLDGFIRFTERCLDFVDDQVPFHLPARVLIVFGQCFGHLHDSSVNNSRFQVLSFTYPGSCETQFRVDVDAETEDVFSIHYQLEAYIDEEMKTHGSRGVETDEPNCLVSRLNSTTSSEQMEVSDEGIFLSSSSSLFSSDSCCGSSPALIDSGNENMEVNDSTFSKDIDKRKESKLNSRRQEKNP